MAEETKVVETMSAEQYEAQQKLETSLNAIATASTQHGSGKLLKFTRSTKVTRADVVESFTNAFQMIGGVDRLALWADQNPGDFYKLFGKLMPPAASDLLDGERVFTVRHVLPPSEMDVSPRKTIVDAEYTEVDPSA